MLFPEHASPQPPQSANVEVRSVSHPSSCRLLLQSPHPLAQVPMQLPPLHVGATTWFDEHTIPQAPQSLRFDELLVSQPSVCLLLLQSAKPELQAPVQTPLVQTGVAMLLFEQTSPHPPQSLTFDEVLVSQPSVCLLLLQSAKPALQAPVQAPLEQTGVAMLLFEQTSPHPPQSFRFDAVPVSQPSVCLLPLQSAKPALQAPVQTPLVQTGVAMLLFEQTSPHPPQLLTSVLPTLTSQPSVCLLLLQSANPAAQVPLQTPAPLHVTVAMWFDEHATPHPPQLVAVVSDVSHPLVCLLLSQSPKPALQAPVQTPAVHTGVAMLLFEQMTPQPPQLLTSVPPMKVSQPSVCLLLLQSTQPAAQVPLQTPAPLQVTVAMWFAEQARPQPPQLLVVVSAVSQPSVCLLLLQSPKPALQAPLHTSFVQSGVAMLLFEQTSPHPPQLATVVIAVSHPSVCLLPLQSAKPALQAPVQTPLVHTGVAMLLFEHTTPQPPQLLTLVPAMFTSQPSVCLLLLQSAKPELQAPVQTPLVQTGVAMLLFEQTSPHPPQSLTFDEVFVSQPSVCLLLLQSAKPALHAPVH